MKFGSLFAGIGGFDLGLERAGMECAFQVENDDYCTKVLAKHWPEVPRYGDIREVDWSGVDRVDLVCGGFPCTDISSARTSNERLGLTGPQSGLWYEFLRCIKDVWPRFVVVENSPEWRSWVPTVRWELGALGYRSIPLRLQAGSFGLEHRRPRAFVVADSHGKGESLRAIYAQVARIRPIPRPVRDERPSPPGGFRLDDGIANGAHRCRVAGNAVVPPVAEWIGRQILTEGQRVG